MTFPAGVIARNVVLPVILDSGGTPINTGVLTITPSVGLKWAATSQVILGDPINVNIVAGTASISLPIVQSGFVMGNNERVDVWTYRASVSLPPGVEDFVDHDFVLSAGETPYMLDMSTPVPVPDTVVSLLEYVPIGSPGADGEPGAPGPSAYEIAVEVDGFVGTEEDWLLTLVGPPGEQGPQGIPGHVGNGAGPQLLVQDIRNFLIGAETLDPTGVTSMTAIIQRAVDSLSTSYDALPAARKPTGYQIYFPEGYYRTAGTVNWKRGVGIKGQSRRTVFLPDNTFITGTSPAGYDYTDCYFEDFTIDGSVQNSATPTTNIKGIFIKRMIRSRFERIEIRNTWATGFGVDFLQDVHFIDCVASGCGRGIAVLAMNPATSSGHSGFGIGTGDFALENVSIIGCIARNNGINGFFTEELGSGGRSNGLRVIGNTAYGNYIGMKECGSLGAIITGNQFLNNTIGVGIAETILTPLGGRDGILANNVISGNGTGVLLGDGGPYAIRGNEISFNIGIGIRVVDEGGTALPHNTIEQNRIHDNGGVGVSIERGMTNFIFRQNSMWSNTGGNLSSNGNVIAQPSIIGNDGDGAAVTVLLSGQSKVTDNTGLPVSPLGSLGPLLSEQVADTALVRLPLNDYLSPIVDRAGLVSPNEFGGVALGHWGVGESAMIFNGSTGYVQFGNPASLDSLAAFTVEAIIRPDVTSAGVIVSRDNNTIRGWLMRVHTDGRLQGFKGTVFSASTNPLTVGQIVHVATVYNGTDVRVYVNGVLTGTPAAATGVIGNSASPHALGIRHGTGTTPDTQKYNGVITGVAIYGTALSAARILAHAQAAGLA